MSVDLELLTENLRLSAESDARPGRWGWPASGGGAGLWEVDGRQLRGIPRVDHGHEPCWQIAARMARYVMRRARCPAVSSRRFLFAGNRACQRTDGGIVAGPRGLVLPIGPRACRGTFGGGVKDARADRISKGEKYPAHVLSGRGSMDIGCGRPAAQRRARPGPVGLEYAIGPVTCVFSLRLWAVMRRSDTRS